MEIPAPDRASRAQLRRLVFELRSTERRRVFPARLHLGDPDGPRQSYADEGIPLDPALRADAVHALLDDRQDGPAPAAWLTRVGWPEPHDLDRLWLSTLWQVFGERDLVPRWVAVVTKNGWYDAVGEDRVVWKRLRIR